ncbi:TolB family protein [candidate division KSB1 bacterium]
MTGKAVSILILATVAVAGCGGDDDGSLGDFFGSDLKQLTFDGGSSPSWSPDGQSIVYTNQQNLWLISADGGDPIRITTMSGAEISPMWHPDPSTREIVFINSPDADNFVLYTLAADGGEPVEVLSTTARLSSPSFTSDGQQIAFIDGKKGAGIKLLPASGEGPIAQLSNSDGWDLVMSAHCSPMEGTIAYVENRSTDFNIYTLSLSGGTPANLTNMKNTGGDVNKLYYVDWSKDGSELVYTHSANPYFNTFALYTLPAGGGTPETWTEDPVDNSVDYGSPSYAPDGNRLACSHSGDIWILTLR